MALIDDVKQALRVSGATFNTEITDLIESAKRDLAISGINIDKEISVGVIDPLLKKAIITYCKANFGYDNPDSEKLMESYRSLEIHMALSEDYQVVV